MYERMPLTVSVRPDLFDAALASMPMLQALLFTRLVMWMAVNAAALPYDLQACCEIVRAKSLDARAAVSALTGLEAVHHAVDCPGGQNVSTWTEDLSTTTWTCPRG